MAGSSQGNADSGPVDGIGGEINDIGVAKLAGPHELATAGQRSLTPQTASNSVYGDCRLHGRD
jgi:hypothetical protein